jgi:hypothetical protein
MGLRGAARVAFIAGLADLDNDLMAAARWALPQADRQMLEHEAEEELAPFRGSMPPDAYRRALEAAVENLVRERLSLPTVTFK